nr:inhibitor of Bruton tyrosine kinase-like isoform X1 [Procambarus clarkii]
MSRVLESDCTFGCRSRQHGSQITAAIIRGSEAQAIAYMRNLCQRYWCVTDETGKTALHTAASCGKRKVVKWLLSKGASFNQRDWESGYTPLHRALFYGQLHVACALIQAGGSISAVDHDALSPLDHVNFDRPPIVSFTSSLPTHVYVWGNNTNYNLGQTSQHARGTPECLDSLHRECRVIKDVALNKFHTLFLASSGRVYTCGHGQGGRLGLETNSPVITPRPIKAFVHTNVIKVAAGPDHSLFLTDSGQVWSCGTNLYHQLGLSPPPENVYTPRMLTWHKSHKDVIVGIGAAKYHSVMWTSRVLYTFGLNAGQLGHFKNANECTIVTPRNVTSVVVREDSNLASVAVSDGATVLSTSNGDVYVLHQYQIRKVASKMHGVVKVACVGGHLDSKVGADGLIEHGGDDLKIAVLTGRGTGHLYLWTEQSSHLSRCLFSINREISLTDFCLGRHCLAVVTDNGEAFSAIVLPARERKTSEKPLIRKSWGSSSQLIEFLDRSTCVVLRLTRIVALHRTICVMCDPKGLNFAALQNEPNSYLLDLPQVSTSTLKEDFKTLLKEENESDTIHDVVICCGAQKFFAHSYILACHSGYFRHRLFSVKENLKNDNVDVQKEWGTLHNSEKKYFTLQDVPPDIFQEVLVYIYTGSCKLISQDCTSHGQLLDNVTGNNPSMNDWVLSENLQQKPNHSVIKEVEHLQSTNKQKKKKGGKLSRVKTAGTQPVRAALAVAKKLEVTSLERELDKIRILDGYIEAESGGCQKDMKSWEEYKYSREKHQELWDVMIRSKTGDILGAHKCILAARLEYFRCMFGASWIEATASKSLNMPLPTSVLVIILDYLYEDESPKLRHCRDPEFVCNVLAVADQFFITRLREICEDVLSGLLTLKNAAELLEFASNYNAVQLKETAMQFISLNLTAVLENGSLLSISNSDVLVELSGYYRRFIPRMSCRMMTPHNYPPYADELEQILEERPFILPESDEEWDEDTSVKCDKLLSAGGGSGSARKKKRQYRNSQGDTRSRKTSASSVSSSDCDTTRDIEEDLETLDFSDLEERVPSESPDGKPDAKINYSKLPSMIHPTEIEAVSQVSQDSNSWQKVCKKKSVVGHSVMLVKSPRESPLPENIEIDHRPTGTPSPQKSSQAELDKTVTPSSVSGAPGGASLPKFPSLQNSMVAVQKTGQLPKNSKTGKMSQKQRKKLAAEAAASAAEAALPVVSKMQIPNSTPIKSAPAWGSTKDLIATATSPTSSQTLADIMKAEEARVKKVSAPVVIRSSKTLHMSGTPVRKSFSWGHDDISQVGQMNTESEGSGIWSMVASSPPVSPVGSNLPSPGHSHLDKSIAQSPSQLPAVPDFSHILLEEETHSDNLIKERSKPLAMIQLEDRAIEELLAFYGSSECFEEKITVTRVRTTVANPTWSK